jgi:hypothetical protein
MKLSAMALLAGAGLLFASPAAAQDDPWMAEVATQLQAVLQATSTAGLTPAADPVTGTLAMGGADAIELELPAGSYAFVGVCDTDCSDLDLVLSTGEQELDSDVETDDTPIVTVSLTEPAVVTLRVDMAACTSAAPCRYGIGLYTAAQN